MSNFKHSVFLQVDKCKGCTNCVKRCPTEAIRIQNGHSVIDEERCIDCGECIKHCPYNAKKALSDKLEKYKDYKYKIALPAPALYGQFDNLDDIDYIVSGLLECGFDDVYEVAKAAEIISEYTRNYLRRTDIAKPVISSACPVIARLISKRFPYLCDNLLPIIPPIELAAKMAKKEAKEKHPELKDEDICAVFISPCPAKVSYVRNPIGVEKSAVDGVVSISEIYFLLVNSMKKIVNPEVQSQTGLVGVSWAGSGGEAAALFNDKYLSADGIENCIKVLDEIENENFAGLEFIELNACSGGCVGGALTVENPYIAKARLQILRRYLPVSQNHIERRDPTAVPEGFLWDDPLEYSPVMQLDSDMGEAMKKMADIQAIYEMFPHLDCGACGAPTCRAFAEDVVKNNGDVSDCIFIMRERIRELYKEREKNDGK
ncbi:MAG: 4Fe-4S dicluster domain-containing protein [Ruminococcaceae bacterium]|nr:4Fe-4S dicluster domain-containing protein [Oscillospiraceae bacterium]